MRGHSVWEYRLTDFNGATVFGDAEVEPVAVACQVKSARAVEICTVLIFPIRLLESSKSLETIQ